MSDSDLRRRPLRDTCAPASIVERQHASLLFNIRDGKDIHDTEGVVLAGVAEARDQAIATAGDMIKHDGHTVWNGSPWMMNVTDEAGTPVFTLRFSADDHAA
jgi:hypothetical protein